MKEEILNFHLSEVCRFAREGHICKKGGSIGVSLTVSYIRMGNNKLTDLECIRNKNPGGRKGSFHCKKYIKLICTHL